MSLLDAAKAARHDLGKYVCFEQRWLPEGASDEELLEALRADVLETRRSRQGVETAPQIWARLRGPLADLPQAARVDASVDLLEQGLEGLRQGSLERARLEELASAARDISDTLKQLVSSLKEA